jgi:hypothetical protein
VILVNEITGKRGPAAQFAEPDLSFIHIDRIALATLLMERLKSTVDAKSKLRKFADLCNIDAIGQSITDQTAGNYISRPPRRCATWRFKRIRKTEVLQAIGFADKSEHPTILSKIGSKREQAADNQGSNSYSHEGITLGGQLRLKVTGSEARVHEADNLPDANGQRKAGPFGRVDVRIEHCEILTEDNQQYDNPFIPLTHVRTDNVIR